MAGTKERKKRVRGGDLYPNEQITTVTNITKKSKSNQNPSTFRFSPYDLGLLHSGVDDLKKQTRSNISNAKFLKALIRLNSAGGVDQQELIKILESFS